MEKTTEISLPFQITASIDQTSRILLNIDELEYHLPMEILFNIAKRNNPKRKFLFVSKVLGKHIPIRPIVLRLIGAILARSWFEKCYGIQDVNNSVLADALIQLQTTPQIDSVTYSTIKNSINEIINTPLKLPESTLFIGFAETATGIAQAVFSNFTNASYIHTTREKLVDLEPNFTFNEEHSHAVEHCLYTLDKDFLCQFERIVLIDDELTTGNTAINLMKNLPGHLFGLITILDWRSKEQLEKFNSLDDIAVTVSALVKGTIRELTENGFVDSAASIVADKADNDTNIVSESTVIDTYNVASSSIINAIEDTKIQLLPDINIPYKSICIEDAKTIHGYLNTTGRFGISYTSKEEIQTSIQKAASLLKPYRSAGNCLCLGTEEFIYIPCMIANELGDDIFFHSTTRSPIFSKVDMDYCIKNKVEFPSPSKDNILNYLYNIPFDFYDQVFLFSEKPLKDKDIKLFNQIFNTFNIKNITYVSWI